MGSDSTRHRSEGRYRIESKATRVQVRFTEAPGEPRQLIGQLADISLHGMRANLNGRIDVDRRVDLTMEVLRHAIVVERSAVVRWQHPRDAFSWWTGFELEEPLDETLIEQLATIRVLNRRRDPRYEADKPVRVRTELSNCVHDARLINYSKGGFGLAFKQPLELPHERLMMIIPKDDEDRVVPARVMWSRAIGSSHCVGCAFTDLDGFVHVRDYAEPHASRRRSLLAPQPAVSLLTGLALATTIALQTNWLLRSKPQMAEAVRTYWASWVVEPIRERWLAADPDRTDRPAERIELQPVANPAIAEGNENRQGRL